MSSHLSASYQYDPANRLLAEDTFTYTYDANGNRITQTRQRDNAPTRYTYDVGNRCVSPEIRNLQPMEG